MYHLIFLLTQGTTDSFRESQHNIVKRNFEISNRDDRATNRVGSHFENEMFCNSTFLSYSVMNLSLTIHFGIMASASSVFSVLFIMKIKVLLRKVQKRIVTRTLVACKDQKVSQALS